MSLRVTQLIADLAGFNARLALVEGKARLEIDDENPPPVELIKRVREFKSLVTEHLQAEADAAAAAPGDVNSDTAANVAKSDSRPGPRVVIRRSDGSRLVLEPATIRDPGRDVKPATRETIDPQRIEPLDMSDTERRRWRRENEKLSNADLDTLGAMIAFGDPRARGRGWWF